MTLPNNNIEYNTYKKIENVICQLTGEYCSFDNDCNTCYVPCKTYNMKICNDCDHSEICHNIILMS